MGDQRHGDLESIAFVRTRVEPRTLPVELQPPWCDRVRHHEEQHDPVREEVHGIAGDDVGEQPHHDRTDERHLAGPGDADAPLELGDAPSERARLDRGAERVKALPAGALASHPSKPPSTREPRTQTPAACSRPRRSGGVLTNGGLTVAMIRPTTASTSSPRNIASGLSRMRWPSTGLSTARTSSG